MNYKVSILKIFSFLAISMAAVCVWYSPVVFKGYSFAIPNATHIIARNIVVSGRYVVESVNNVILNSVDAPIKGELSSIGNKMLAVCAAILYKIVGVVPELINELSFGSVVISAVALFFFSLTAWKIWGYKPALIFALIYIFLPIIWITALDSNYYEYSLLFLSLALFFLFFESKKFNPVTSFISGVFFFLSFLSRDAVALVIPVLLVWMFLYQRKKMLPLILGAVVVFLCYNFLFINYFGRTSNYHLTYFKLGSEESVSRDFSFYGHLYPDPYIYLYNRANYLEQKVRESSGGGLEAQNILKRIANVEAGHSSFFINFKLGPLLMVKHVASLFSLENIGGSLMTLIFFLGLLYIYQKNKQIGLLIILWPITVFLLCSFVVLAQRNHLMDFGFVLAAGIAMGIWFIFCMVEGLINKQEYEVVIKPLLTKSIKVKRNIIVVFVKALFLFSVIYGLVLCSHVMLSRVYNGSPMLKLLEYKEAVLKAKLSNKDVLAVPFDGNLLYALSFSTDISVVKFSEDTLNKLVLDKGVNDAFEEFGVSAIFGYDKKLSAAIIEQTGSVLVEDYTNGAVTDQFSLPKSLILNLIK